MSLKAEYSYTANFAVTEILPLFFATDDYRSVTKGRFDKHVGDKVGTLDSPPLSQGIYNCFDA